MSNVVVNSEYQIFDGERFVDFDAINDVGIRPTFKVCFDDGSSLTATANHLVHDGGKFVEIAQLQVGSTVGPLTVTNVEFDGFCRVFDIVNSESSQYQTNNVISHNCSFVGSSATLIESSKLSTITHIHPKDQRDDLYYFQFPIKDHQYVITVDVSRGRGLDYTAFSVFDISVKPYNVVCTFKNNEIKPSVELPLLLNQVGRYYNLALILVENNDLGESVGNALWYDHEYDNLVWTHNEQIASSGVIGVKTTRKVKSVGTTAIKTLIENHQIQLNDYRYVQELAVYVRQRRGLYGAQDTRINDDLTSTLMLFGWLTQQRYFQDMTDSNVNIDAGKSFVDKLDDYMPMGYRVDGVTDDLVDYPQLTDDQIGILK